MARSKYIIGILSVLLLLGVVGAASNSTNSIAPTTYISTPQTSAPTYAPFALGLFCLGVIMLVILIFLALAIIKMGIKNSKLRILGIFGFAMATSIVFLYASFYQSTTSTSAYNIISNNVLITIHKTSITTIPLATSSFYGALISGFLVISTGLGFILPFAFFAMRFYKR